MRCEDCVWQRQSHENKSSTPKTSSALLRTACYLHEVKPDCTNQCNFFQLSACQQLKLSILLPRLWGNRNFHLLLIGGHSDTTLMKDTSSIFNSYKYIYPLTQKSYFWECILLTHLHPSKWFMSKVIHFGFVCKSKRLETNQVSMGREVVDETIVYEHNRI